MDANRPRIWLLSAYAADSHLRWADHLVSAQPDLGWERFELPGRHFAWRIRGNPLSWLDAFGGPPPDAVVATSMVDLATIRGLHPSLAKVPTLLYFHENQFAYPRSDRQTTSVDAQMVQLYAALAADRVLFNSTFNRRSFLAGVDALMKRMPDRVPDGLRARLDARSDVLPVPVAPIEPSPERDSSLLVWNHRWEYDKDPDLFAEAAIRLAERGRAFRLALLGPRGDRPVAALRRLREQLSDRIARDAFPEREAYASVLARAAVVVSTARHEFQGLAVMEAVRAGCRPVVPDALCYPEWYPDDFRYRPGDVASLVDLLERALDGGLPAPPALDALDPVRLDAEWRDEIDRLMA